MHRFSVFLLLLTMTWCSALAKSYTVRFHSSGCERYLSVLAGTGAQVTVTASPMFGYRFSQWNDGNTDNPRTVTVTGNAVYTAEYEKKCFTLRLYAEGCTTPTTIIAPFDEQVTMYAEDTEDLSFQAWSDGNTDNPRTVTVVGNVQYTALYTPVETGMEPVSQPAVESEGALKTIHHGRVLILRGNKVYDTMGTETQK